MTRPLPRLRPFAAAACIAAMLSGCATMREPASEALAMPGADAPGARWETLPDVVDAQTRRDAAKIADDNADAPWRPLLDRARDLIGVRYRYGGSEPRTGFDCSGFVRYVFRDAGVPDLPRGSAAMSTTSGVPVARDALAPGDLLFFKIRRNAVSHVAIYLGDGQFIHAPSGGGKVRIEAMTEPYWQQRYAGARRVLALPASAGAGVSTSAAAHAK